MFQFSSRKMTIFSSLCSGISLSNSISWHYTVLIGKKKKPNMFTYGDPQILHNAYVLQLIYFNVKSRNQPNKFSTDQRISVITAMATIYIT